MPLFKGPVLLSIVFRFPVAPGGTRPVRYAKHNTPRAQRPDLDNLEKQICDALNGVAWHDDAQVVIKASMKLQDLWKEGSTELYVEELVEGDKVNPSDVMARVAASIKLHEPELPIMQKTD